jgi:hypothetical protein
MVVVIGSLFPSLVYCTCALSCRSADVQENRDAGYRHQLYHYHDVVGAALVRRLCRAFGPHCQDPPMESAPRASRCCAHGSGGASDRSQLAPALSESSYLDSAPLAAPLLLLSLYRLSFPPLVPGYHRETRRHVFLLLLTIGALMSTGGLVLLDLLFP